MGKTRGKSAYESGGRHTTSRYTRRRPQQRVACGVYRSSSGLYEINYRDEQRRLHWEATGRSLIEAKARRAELVAAKGRGRKTLGWAAQGWLQELNRRVAAGGLSEQTRERYRSAFLNQIEPRLGRQPLAQLNKRRLSQLLSELAGDGLSDSGRQLIRTVLRSLLTYTAQQGLGGRNALAALASTGLRAETATAIGALPAADVNSLLAAAPHNWRLAFKIAVSTGLRPGELLGLRWRDLSADAITIAGQLDRQRRHLAFAAGDPRRRTLPLPTYLAAAIAEHRASSNCASEDELVFSNKREDGYSLRALELAFRQATAAAGLDPALTLHSLRDSYAASLIADGEDPDAISRRLGHRSPATTLRRYGRSATSTSIG